MTEHKKLSYELEDIFVLGKKLPVVAMNQLPKIAEKFSVLPDHPDYYPGIGPHMRDHIMAFYDENKKYLDDERELREIFTRYCKKGLYSHHYLNMIQAVKALMLKD